MSDRLTTLAMLWTLERRDGVTIGLTDHDRDLVIEGRRYHAAPGMIPAAIRRSDGLDAAISETEGALSSAAIAADDLIAGRWDAARITVAIVDWARGGAPLVLNSGTIGAVELEVDAAGGGAFRVELHGPAAALDRAVAEETSATCRASLGDRRCRVAMAGRRRFARVRAVEGASVMLDQREPVADAYGGGTLRWLGGAACGLEQAILRSDGERVTLSAEAAGGAAPGLLVLLREGCDKTVATCVARFGNVVNFRGEPYLPGMDLLTRYPGA